MANRREYSSAYDGNAARKLEREPRVPQNVNYNSSTARQIEPERKILTRKQKQELIRLSEIDIRKSKYKNLNYPKIVKNVACAGLMLTLLLGVVFGEVRLTELQTEITSSQSYLTELQGTQIQLEMQVSSLISEDEIEDYAKYVLGMEQIDQNQIIYIDSNAENKGTVYVEENKGVFDTILSWFGL